MTTALERRAAQVRSRALVRAWEYRQRHHAKGVWGRLRRLLADSRVAYVISDETARQLVEEGLVPEPVGGELQPPKTILCVSAERIATLPGATEVPVRLGPDILAARALVLVRFA